MKRNTMVAAAAVVLVLVVALFGYLWLTRRGPVLTVATWPGTYQRAQTSALLIPFARRTGADVRIAEYDGGTAELARQVQAHKYAWDVMDLELPDAVAACTEGLLEKIDPTQLPAGVNGVPAGQDFVAGAIGPCWVGSVVYSQVVGFDTHRFAGASPSSLSDFFDVRRFPGPRAMRSDPKLNLEMALLADGVAPRDVYPMLATPAGIARALAKLDTIRGDIVWWTPSDPPAQMLHDGRAAFATMLDGDVFDAANDGRPVGVIWDRQLYEFDAFGVPKGNPKRALAMDFIRFATESGSLAGVSSWVPYGPARRSAVALVGDNPELHIAMTPFLTTTQAHFATAFRVDDRWWRAHQSAVEARWQEWLSKK
ncbi:MAG: ABC transporter substrate-binding protein [Alphaproteobacteria bacterium]|nr:ABC transporter substrate-binding protein [Alphaproteobacteria bacterium]